MWYVILHKNPIYLNCCTSPTGPDKSNEISLRTLQMLIQTTEQLHYYVRNFMQCFEVQIRFMQNEMFTHLSY